MKQDKRIFRIRFYNDENICEIYAQQVGDCKIFGFIEVKDFLYGQSSNTIVDPSEEKLRAEFSDVKSTYIPMDAIIRIDEVEKVGVAKMKDTTMRKGNISTFPPKRGITQQQTD